MNYVILDTETTGTNTDEDYILELAWCVVTESGMQLTNIRDELCKFSKRIPSGAKAVHHITEDDVIDASPMEDVLELLARDIDEFDVKAAVAHNGAFDFPLINNALERCAELRSLVPKTILEIDTVCTLRLARRLFPKMEGHSLQFLRYDLGLDESRFHAGEVHRADNDVDVLISVFKMLKGVSGKQGEDFVKYCYEPFLVESMPFGKHKGSALKDIPRNYLTWLLSIDLDDDLRYSISWVLER